MVVRLETNRHNSERPFRSCGIPRMGRELDSPGVLTPLSYGFSIELTAAVKLDLLLPD